ncbi:MAG TPA: hypothetical protein VI670_18170 [Thermoanaerobaculia bacterium]
MDRDRRAAPRHLAPDDLVAEIGGIRVRLLDLSLVGAKAEHGERFPLDSVHLTLERQGRAVTVPVRIARSEIVGRQDQKLIYQTGLYFVNLDSSTECFLAALLDNPQPAPPNPPPTPQSLDDTWTRQVRLLRNELDEHLPYAQFKLTPTGWRKDYVASPNQPEDGFTILRARHDFHELQRTFEVADPETRRMMQVALESELLKGVTIPRSG